MQKNKITKAVFFGLGSAGQRHLRNLRNLKPNINIFYYKETGKNFLINNKLNKVEGDILKKYNLTLIKRLSDLKSINPDIAFICSPSSRHIFFGIYCAKIGCHLFIEKPISNSLQNIDTLSKIVNKKKLILNVGYQFLHHPLTKKLKEIVKKNKFGNLLRGEIRMNEDVKKYRKYGKFTDLLITKKKKGGGILLEQSHDISVLTWLFESRFNVIFCNTFRHKELGFEKGAEDAANLTLINKFRGSKTFFDVYLSSFAKKKKKQITLLFSKAKIHLDYVKNFLLIESKKKKKILKVKIKRNDLFIYELKDFLKSIKNKNLNNSSFLNSILTLKTITKAKKISNYV